MSHEENPRAYQEDKSFGALTDALQTLRYYKPNDRSEKDRYWTIAITELEKVIALFSYFIRDGGGPT
jgi:hypothetical protein